MVNINEAIPTNVKTMLLNFFKLISKSIADIGYSKMCPKIDRIRNTININDTLQPSETRIIP